MKITICGSMAFYDEMKRIQLALEEVGHAVKIPELSLEMPEKYGGGREVYFGQYIEEHGGIDAFPEGDEIWDMKEGAIRDHFDKIAWSDGILVVNQEKRGVSGYIGGNTLIEVGHAFHLGKKIYILHHVSPELSYKQEIMGMKPVTIMGDLAKIR